MRPFIAIAFFVCLTSLVPSVTEADSSPSLSTTTTWLSQNLPGASLGFDIVSQVEDNLVYSFDGCTFTVTDEKRWYNPIGADSVLDTYSLEFKPRSGAWWNGRGTQIASTDLNGAAQGVTATVQVDLKTVDVQSIVVEHRTIGTEGLLAAEVINAAPGLVRLSADDETLMNRILKAFTHAVKLCGGGSDPF